MVLAVLCVFCATVFTADINYEEQRKKLHKTYQDGNYKDAYEGFRKLALDPENNPKKVGSDLDMATNCLRNLNRVNETDEFREQVIEVHKDNWRLLLAAAKNIMNDRKRT